MGGGGGFGVYEGVFHYFGLEGMRARCGGLMQGFPGARSSPGMCRLDSERLGGKMSLRGFSLFSDF